MSAHVVFVTVEQVANAVRETALANEPLLAIFGALALSGRSHARLAHANEPGVALGTKEVARAVVAGPTSFAELSRSIANELPFATNRSPRTRDGTTRANCEEGENGSHTEMLGANAWAHVHG